MTTLRKLETRTKIQLGGLVLKSGLADLLHIMPGDDLQSNASKYEDAQILLGALIEASERLIQQEDMKDFWKTLGKMHILKSADDKLKYAA